MEGMFVAHEVALRVSLASAQSRLLVFFLGRCLSDASEAAYKGGLAGLVRVGPLGDIPGASKLVQVSVLDPVYRDDAMTLALRWEATGVTGGLFPVLDADISLLPAGEQKTRLALAGSYRPPLGRLGSGLDKAILNRIATATIRALLRNVADALGSPGTAAGGETLTAAHPAPPPVIAP